MAIAYNPRIVTDGLVLCLDAANPKSYPGSGTTWFDLTRNDNDVTMVNGPTFNSDHVSFDGGNDYGWVANLNYGGGTFIDEMSVFAWIRTTFNSGTVGSWSNSNWSLLDFDRSEVFSFAVNGTGEIQMSGDSVNNGGIGNSTYDIVGNGRYNDGEWHYIGLTFSVANQEIVMYADGEVDRTFTANGSMSGLGNGVTRYGIIGDGSETGVEGSPAINSVYYDGDIGALHFYDSFALSALHVKQNFSALRGRYGL